MAGSYTAIVFQQLRGYTSFKFTFILFNLLVLWKGFIYSICHIEAARVQANKVIRVIRIDELHPHVVKREKSILITITGHTQAS